MKHFYLDQGEHLGRSGEEMTTWCANGKGGSTLSLKSQEEPATHEMDRRVAAQLGSC